MEQTADQAAPGLRRGITSGQKIPVALIAAAGRMQP